MPIFVFILSIIFLSGSCLTTLAAIPDKNRCLMFDNIALQLAVAENNMGSPLTLAQIESSLGSGNQEKELITRTYSWSFENRVLIVKTHGDNITANILTGKDNGSPISKKMEQIHVALKSATSIWSIKDIQRQLGEGITTSKKFQNQSWYCNKSSLTVATNQDNSIINATINYQGTQKQLAERLGSNRPKWDNKEDLFGESSCTWQRVFAD